MGNTKYKLIKMTLVFTLTCFAVLYFKSNDWKILLENNDSIVELQIETGPLFKGEVYNKKVYLKNNYDADVRVDVKRSCGCLIINPISSELKRGHSMILNLTYDSNASLIGKTKNLFSVLISSDKIKGHPKVNGVLTSNIKPALLYDDEVSLEFSTNTKGRYEREFNFLNISPLNLKIDVKMRNLNNGKLYLDGFKSSVIGPGKKIGFKVMVDGPLDERPILGMLDVSATKNSIFQSPKIALSIPVRAYPERLVDVTPASLVFARNYQSSQTLNGTEKQLKVILSKDVKVTSVKTTNPYLKVSVKGLKENTKIIVNPDLRSGNKLNFEEYIYIYYEINNQLKRYAVPVIFN